MPLRAAVFGGLVGLVAASCAQAQDPHRPAIGGIGSPVDAMIFYVARGVDGACGPGCSEWIAAEGIVDAQVIAAMGAIERHRFVDTALVNQAYEDTSLPIGLAQTISKPSVDAR